MGACDNCRPLKVKCSNRDVICKRCANLNLECTYNYLLFKKSPCVTCRQNRKSCDKVQPSCGTCTKKSIKCVYLSPNINASEYFKNKNGSKESSEAINSNNLAQYGRKEIPILPNLMKKEAIMIKLSQANRIENFYKFFDIRTNSWNDSKFKPFSLSTSLLQFSTVFSLPKLSKGKEIQKSNAAFSLTGILVSHLVNLYFFNVGAYYPLVPKAYLSKLLQVAPDANSTKLLLYSICLSASNFFEPLSLCAMIKDKFAKAVFSLYKLTYTTPSIPLLFTNLLLSFLNNLDFDHPLIFTQRFYHCQAVRLSFLFGVNLERLSRNFFKRELFRRLYFVLSINDITLFSPTFKFEVPLYEYFDYKIPSFRKEIDTELPKYLPQYPNVVVEHNQPFYYLMYMIRVVEILENVSTLKVQLMANQSTQNEHTDLSSPNKLLAEALRLEAQLHQNLFVSPLTQGIKSLKLGEISVVEDPGLIHVSLSHIYMIADLYQPFTSIETNFNLISAYDFSVKSVNLRTFFQANCNVKFITLVLLAVRTILTHQSHYINTYVYYKWLYLLTLMTYINDLVLKLRKLDEQSKLLGLLLSYSFKLIDMLHRHKERYPTIQTVLNYSSQFYIYNQAEKINDQ